MNLPRALVVEDDPSWRQLLSELLTDEGFSVDSAATLEEATAALKAEPHRLALVDLSLSPNQHDNAEGLQVLDTIRALDPACRAVLLTGFATVERAVAALTEHGAFRFLRKENFQRAELRQIAQMALISAPAWQKNSLPAAEAPLSQQPAPASGPSHLRASRALLVEDDAGWRALLQELLEDLGLQTRVCAGFGEAMGRLRREKFALAVMDLSLSGVSPWGGKIPSRLEGLALLDAAHKKKIPALVVSGISSPQEIQRAYAEHGVFAYLEKQTFERAAFLRLAQEALTVDSSPAQDNLSSLTRRERETLTFLAQGLTNKEIAARLVISENTVKRHLKAIFEKLEVHTRAAAAARAGGEGPVTPASSHSQRG